MLTAGGLYGDDLAIEGAVWATFVRSSEAHARIVSIDASDARSAPGVVGAYTADDIGLAPLPAGFPGIPDVMARPILAADTVRFVGEAVALVLTEERRQGEDAIEQVYVEYESLPALVEAAIAESSDVLLFPDHGSNVVVDVRDPLPEGFFDGCEVVVRQRMRNQRLAPCPLEVRSTAARWFEGGLTVFASTQVPHRMRDWLAQTFGVPASRVRVVAPDVGGGFGAKTFYPEDVAIAWAAREIGRPVRWTETRSESMLCLTHGRAQIQDVAIGGSRDGKILAYALDIVQDAGAYPAYGALLPTHTRRMAPGTYAIPRVAASSVSVVTNTTPISAYRGAGRPEATAAIERAVDLFADEIGVDPATVRLENLVESDAFPYTTPTGLIYDSGDYGTALRAVLDEVSYDHLREEQRRRRSEGGQGLLGVGMATYVEITNGAGDTGEYAAIEVLPSGKAKVYTGTSPHGQGHVTTWSMLAADQLGIPIDDIEVIANDTDLVPAGMGTFGSRSLQSGGVAVHEAAILLVDKAREIAATMLEASPDDVVLGAEGTFHVIGTPTVSRSWADVAHEASEETGLRVEHRSAPPAPTFPFGAHVAVVEVDVETGEVRLVRIVAADDAGTIINPLIAEGQRHGGIAQGVAQALMEEVRYDANGNPITANLADYAMISACELPSFDLVHMETPTPVNALGAKGIGESGTVGSTPAVQNAVVDALSHLGVRHIDMPTTPERVWAAVQRARNSIATRE